MSKVLRGFFAIALTPFSELGDLLWDELARECDWIVRAGAHGIVWPVNDSEQYVLSAAERIRGYALVTQAVNGRIPVMAGVADNSKAGAAAFAEAAARAGAEAVIAVPPWSVKMTSPALIEDYYRAIAQAAGVPVCLQNLGGMMGSSLPSTLVAELCSRVPRLCYVKEERDPHGDNVSELIGLRSPAIAGVFTGGLTLGMVASHRRGAVGCIASADLADVTSQIWDLMEAGDETAARRIQDSECILRRALLDLPYPSGIKEVLVRRGVFSSNSRRSVGRVALDRFHAEELDRGLKAVEPYRRV
jgi:dihydrodipicolinate synthase/N-acetylneuraminate lyase